MNTSKLLTAFLLADQINVNLRESQQRELRRDDDCGDDRQNLDRCVEVCRSLSPLGNGTIEFEEKEIRRRCCPGTLLVFIFTILTPSARSDRS
jgi:hypothetical protein